MERVGLRLRYCLPLLVCFFRCLHTSQGTVNDFLHFMFCFTFCLIWRGNSDQQSYANDKIIFVVIGYKKVRTFSNKGLYRESSDEMWLMNMVEETFSYLNISKINSAEVQNDGECAFACLNEPMCFSYNLEASASKTGTRVCELLPSDKYNNSDEVIISQKFHHYSIQVSDLMFNIKKNSTCSSFLGALQTSQVLHISMDAELTHEQITFTFPLRWFEFPKRNSLSPLLQSLYSRVLCVFSQ